MLKIINLNFNMDKKEFLTSDILGNLTQRIAKTLPCLKSIDANNIWTRPIELCQRIENNIREVDNVILEVCKESGYYGNNATNPFNFQVLLARVYILLYYRHSEEDLYKIVVFPELQKKMGIYNDKYLTDIQKRISDILKIDQLIKSSQQKAHKSAPKYCIIAVSEGEEDEYFSKFSNELLFRDVCDYLEKLQNDYFDRIDVTSIWLTAKDVIRKLYQETAPESLITRILHKLASNTNTEYIENEAAEAVILCSYMMMRTITKTNHFKRVIKYIENLQNWQDTYILFEGIPFIKELMDEGTIASDDYDYLDGTEQDESTFTKAEVEMMMKEYQNRIANLEQSNKSKDLEIAKYQVESAKTEAEHEIKDEKEQEDMLYNKVCFEFFLLLLENVGLDINNTGNKSRVGELWRMFTGKSGDAIRRFCSQRNPINNHTRADIERLNNKLKEMGINIEIQNQ